MINSQPPSPVFVFWQTVVSVVLGVSAGFALLVFATKPHAEALSNSLTLTAQTLAPSHQARRRPLGPIFPVFSPLDRRLTVLVMGVDSNGQNAERWVATRSDTMMLVTIDPPAGKVGLVSIPRDSRVRIPGHGREKINAAHALGGPVLAMETVKACLGVGIDHFVVVDTKGLKRFFELLGPVEVLFENRMRYRDRAGHLDVDLQPGLQVLDPVQAEEYVRFRHDPRGDLGRMERQQWFFRQVARKLREPQALLKLPQFLGLANECVVTDLSLEDMARTLTFLKDFDANQAETATLPGISATIAGGSYWLPDMQASRVVLERLIGPVAEVELALQDNSDTPAEPILQDNAEATGGESESQGIQYDNDTTRPLSIAIKYPRGAEEIAKRLELLLTTSGLKVAYRWQAPLCECQHEQIIQNSFRADDYQTTTIKQAVPLMSRWPVVVALESRPPTDFTIVIPESSSIITGASDAPRFSHAVSHVLFD